MSKLRTSILLRYIIGYTAVLFIPIILISLLIYGNFFSKIEEDAIATNRSIALNTINQFERTLNELNCMAYKMFDDSDLSFGNPKEDAIKIIDAVGLLERYRSISEVEKIALYYSKYDTFYTNTGTFSFNILYSYLNLDKKNKQNFRNLLITSNEYALHSIQSLSTEEKSLTVSKLIYIVSNPYFLSSKKNAVLFLIDPTYMKNSMNTVEGISLLFDNSGNILLSNINVDTPVDIETLESYSNQLYETDNEQSIIIDSVEYYKIVLPSEEFEISYVMLLPLNNMMNDLNLIKEMYLYSLLILVFISSAVIMLISRAQYNPIKMLNKYASSITGKILSSGKNELESVRLAIEDMDTHKKELDAEILKSKPALKEYDLDNLISGKYKSKEEYNSLERYSGIKLYNSYFCIARYRLTYNENSVPITTQSISQIIEEQSQGDIQLWAKRDMKINVITILICTEYSYVNVKEFLFMINKYISDKYGILCAAGLGNLYSSVQDIGKSYLEADLAMGYRLISGNKIIPIEKIKLGDEAYEINYPTKILRSLEFAITEGDVDTIARELTNITSIIKSEDMPLFTARCISYDMINTVVRIMSAINKKFLFPKKYYPDVMLLAQYESLDDLVNIIKGICIDICEYISNNKENHSKGFISTVHDYIEKNVYDHEFSLQRMAEELNVSQSLISHQFKKETNQTVVGYVNFLRVEKAKELLINTSLSISDIVNKVGYYDVSSFTRKFKKLVGTTPGAYRNQFG